MTTGLRPLRKVTQNDLTKRSATPAITQRAIVRAIRAGREKKAASLPEDGESERGQGRHHG